MSWHEIFAWIRGFGALIAGVLSYLYGDWNGLLIALIVAVCLDYATGLIKAYVSKKLSSEVGFKGILKKFLILFVVALAHVIDKCVGSGETWRNIAIVFYVCNEGLSILENCVACGLPVPEKMKKALLSLEDDTKGDNDDGSTDKLRID